MILLLLTMLSAIAGTIPVLEVRGGVDPGSADYVVRGIEAAEEAGAPAVVLRLDTPGGLVVSAREIVQAQLTSEIPMIVYVEPTGARAGSAGMFITMAAHVAAMAPGTTIGAAHPVQLFGAPEDPEADEPAPMDDKILEDMLAWSRAIAEERGRNAEWMEAAVRESVAVTASEALELEVVDLVADDLPSLLEQIDGLTVETAIGPVTLDVADAELEPVAMTIRQQMVHFLSDPNVLMVLVGLGMIGLYLEFQNPGLLLPGAVGLLALLGAGVGLSILPFNLAGLLLLILGFALFGLEIYTPTVGVFAAAGALAVAAGGVLLFDAVPGLDLRIHPAVLTGVALVAALTAVSLAWLIARDWRSPVATGAEGMVGEQGVVTQGGEGSGWVRVLGEGWRARWKGVLTTGTPVRVVEVKGLTLRVKPETEPNTDGDGS